MCAAKRRKKGLEPNLYETNGYFRYRHPITKKIKGMGKDKRLANDAARQLNVNLMRTDDLLVKFYADRVEGRLDGSISELCDRYLKEYLPTKNIKETTKANELNRINRLKEDLKDESTYDFTVKKAAEYLDKNFTKNSYVKHRGSLRELFDFAKRKYMTKKTLSQPQNQRQSRVMSKFVSE